MGDGQHTIYIYIAMIYGFDKVIFRGLMNGTIVYHRKQETLLGSIGAIIRKWGYIMEIL